MKPVKARSSTMAPPWRSMARMASSHRQPRRRGVGHAGRVYGHDLAVACGPASRSATPGSPGSLRSERGAAIEGAPTFVEHVVQRPPAREAQSAPGPRHGGRVRLRMRLRDGAGSERPGVRMGATSGRPVGQVSDGRQWSVAVCSRRGLGLCSLGWLTGLVQCVGDVLPAQSLRSEPRLDLQTARTLRRLLGTSRQLEASGLPGWLR